MNRFLVAAALIVTACGSAAAGTSPNTGAATSGEPATTAPAVTIVGEPMALPTLAITSADNTITVVRAGIVVGVYPQARLAVDGHTLVRSMPGPNGATTVEWIDLSTGTSTGSATIPAGVSGPLELAALDEQGNSAVVVSAAAAAVGEDIAGARSSSEIVIVSRPAAPTPTGKVVYRTTVPGNVVPEMLSPSDAGTPASVFTVEYLPANHPAVYRVRVLDTSTSTLAIPADLREKVQAADESMAGISRAQVMVPTRKLLLTLYRGRNPDGTLYAFVHALRYDGIPDGPWPGTYCLDLPDSLQLQASAASVAVSPDQSMLFFANGNGILGSFRVADLDDHHQSPAVHSTGQLKNTSTHAPAITATDVALWVAYDSTVVELDPADLGQRQMFVLADDVLAMVPSDSNLIAVGPTAVTMFGADGVVHGRWPIAVTDPRRVTVVT